MARSTMTQMKAKLPTMTLPSSAKLRGLSIPSRDRSGRKAATRDVRTDQTTERQPNTRRFQATRDKVTARLGRAAEVKSSRPQRDLEKGGGQDPQNPPERLPRWFPLKYRSCWEHSPWCCCCRSVYPWVSRPHVQYTVKIFTVCILMASSIFLSSFFLLTNERWKVKTQMTITNPKAQVKYVVQRFSYCTVPYTAGGPNPGAAGGSGPQASAPRLRKRQSAASSALDRLNLGDGGVVASCKTAQELKKNPRANTGQQNDAQKLAKIIEDAIVSDSNFLFPRWEMFVKIGAPLLICTAAVLAFLFVLLDKCWCQRHRLECYRNEKKNETCPRFHKGLRRNETSKVINLIVWYQPYPKGDNYEVRKYTHEPSRRTLKDQFHWTNNLDKCTLLALILFAGVQGKLIYNFCYFSTLALTDPNITAKPSPLFVLYGLLPGFWFILAFIIRIIKFLKSVCNGCQDVTTWRQDDRIRDGTEAWDQRIQQRLKFVNDRNPEWGDMPIRRLKEDMHHFFPDVPKITINFENRVLPDEYAIRPEWMDSGNRLDWKRGEKDPIPPEHDTFDGQYFQSQQQGSPPPGSLHDNPPPNHAQPGPPMQQQRPYPPSGIAGQGETSRPQMFTPAQPQQAGPLPTNSATSHVQPLPPQPSQYADPTLAAPVHPRKPVPGSTVRETTRTEDAKRTRARATDVAKSTKERIKGQASDLGSKVRGIDLGSKVKGMELGSKMKGMELGSKMKGMGDKFGKNKNYKQI